MPWGGHNTLGVKRLRDVHTPTVALVFCGGSEHYTPRVKHLGGHMAHMLIA